MIKDIEIIKNLRLLAERKLIIWGAKDQGKRVKKQIDEMGINHVSFFCDNDLKKWNTTVLDVVVISPEGLMEYDKSHEIIVVVASNYESEIIAQLMEKHLVNTWICSGFGFSMAVRLNIEEDIVKSEYRKKYLFEFELNKEVLKQKQYYEELYTEKNWILSMSKDEAIYILQPGKVGSTTLLESLLKADVETVCKQHEIVYHEEHLCGKFRKEYIRGLKMLKKKPVKIITLVREPISRDISSFWQMIKVGRLFYSDFLSNDLYEDYRKFLDYAYYSKDKLKALPGFVKGNIKWGSQFEWFYEEMYATFGLDVFQYPFDKEKGYSIIKKDNVQILLLKLEKLNEHNDVISEFVGLTNVVLENGNEAQDHNYYQTYKEFKRHVCLPKKYVDMYYKGNSYMNHFYSEEEQKQFLKKWEKNIK